MVFLAQARSVQSMYVWEIIVSQLNNMVDLHDKYSHHEKYYNPTGNLQQNIVGILLFVYDWNLSNTREKYETIRDILRQTQHNAQLWNNFFAWVVQKFNFPNTSHNGSPLVRKLHHLELIDCTKNINVHINLISYYSSYQSMGTV